MKITTRVSEATEKWLTTNCRNKTSGAEYILDAFPTLYARTLLDLRGKFSGNEVALLIDAFNGTMLTPQLAGQHVIMSAADSMELDRTDEKWNVEPKDFLARLQALSHFERAVMEIFVRAYWESPETGDGLKNPGSLEEWVLRIASSPINLEG
ncbi:MAG: hypothetical protein V2B18_21180 [Pseudomonadota bacterium]